MVGNRFILLNEEEKRPKVRSILSLPDGHKHVRYLIMGCIKVSVLPVRFVVAMPDPCTLLHCLRRVLNAAMPIENYLMEMSNSCLDRN